MGQDSKRTEIEEGRARTEEAAIVEETAGVEVKKEDMEKEGSKEAK